MKGSNKIVKIDETSHQKTKNLDFQPGLTQTSLYSHRSGLAAWNLEFKKNRDCTVYVAKTKTPIRCAVTTQLICAFVCAYANRWFLMRRLRLQTVQVVMSYIKVFDSIINPYLTDGVSHHYQLGESTFIFRGVRSDF